MDINCDLLVETLAKLLGLPYQDTLEIVILYGTAYVNQKNKLDMMDWLGGISLPEIKDVDELRIDM